MSRRDYNNSRDSRSDSRSDSRGGNRDRFGSSSKYDSGGSIPKQNAIFHGQVKTVKDYGAFIQIPNCAKNGLVHISQISQSRVENIEDVMSVGDKVWCKVISVEDDGRKISLSMKVVNQDSGEDLDPNGVQVSLDAKKRQSFTPYSQPKIELEAIFNTVCRKCGTKGHLAKDCFQQPGGRNYDLLPDDDESERAGSKSHKERKHSRDKEKGEKRKKKSDHDHDDHDDKKKKKKKSH